ncbi:MAG: rhomboid family intramembrane serine protease [Paludibacter sp.]
MAFGITPKFKRELKPDDITTEQFLVVAFETAKKLDWSISQLSENGFIAYTKTSFSSFGEEFRITIDGEVAVLESKCVGSQLVDWGKNKANTDLFARTFYEQKREIPEAEIMERFEALKLSMVSKEDSELNKSPLSTQEKITNSLSIFKPTDNYFITPLLIDLNILLFILMVIVGGVNILLPDADSLINWGANIRPYTIQGDWWRLITNFFLHIGILHLLMNMYALVYIGLILEPYLGKARFVTAYFLTGIAASVCSLRVHDLTISAGASGAIFGMYGVFLAMLTTNLIEKAARKTLLISIGVFVFYNLANGMKDGIDNAAHIGGLISGLIIGYGFYPSLRTRNDEYQENDIEKISIGVISAIVLFSCYLIYINVPANTNTNFFTQKEIAKFDLEKYDSKMKEFAAGESMAMEVFYLPDSLSKTKRLYEIKSRGIYYWNENMDVIYEVEKLNLPPILHKRNRLLMDYCKLRIKSFALMYKKVEIETNMFDDQIEVYNSQIDSVVAIIAKL